MSKYKTGDKFIIEIEEVEGEDKFFRIKSEKFIAYIPENMLDCLKKTTADLPEEYKENTMKRFMEVK